MLLSLTLSDQTLLLRSIALPAVVRQKIDTAQKVDDALHLTLSDDDYLVLTQHLTMTLRTIKNPKTRSTLEHLLVRLTDQHETQQRDAISPPHAAEYGSKNLHAIIDKLECTVPGWADFKFQQMVETLADKLPITNKELADRAVGILAARHDKISRPMFHGLTTEQVGALLSNDWTTDSPGLCLRPDNLTPESVKDTLIIKRAVAFITALGDKGTRATKNGNLNRKFVGGMLDQLDIPACDLQYIRHYNKVTNEEDIFVLHELRLWLKIAKLVRLYRGRIVALKRTRDILAQAEWPILYNALFAAAFQVYNLGYRDRLNVSDGFQQSLAYCFKQLACLDEGWHDIAVAHERCILPLVDAELARLPFRETNQIVVKKRLLEPLSLFGLVELKFDEQAVGRRAYPDLVAFRRTALFGRFLGFD